MRELPEAWQRYHEHGDMDARQELIEEYLPLTRYVASQMSQRLPPSVEFNDLVAYGTLGLLDAIEKFDPARGVKFGTYAVNRIRGAVLDELRSLDWVPRSVRTKARSIERVTTSLGNQLGRMPTDVEIAEELGLNMAEYAEIVADAAVVPVVGLDEPVDGTDDDRQSIVETVTDPGADDPLAVQVGGEIAETVAAVVARLDRRQRTILALYCVEELTLSEIGEVLGVTESRVCQMHTRTVAALQDELEARGAGVVAVG